MSDLVNNGSQWRTHLANKENSPRRQETNPAAINPTVYEGTERPQTPGSITIISGNFFL